MKKLFTINQLDILEKSKVISKTIPDKAIIPAHEYVRMNSFESIVTMTASNAENTSRLDLDSAIFEEPFDICVEHSFLKPLTKKDVELTFHSQEGTCIITCKDSKWQVPMIFPDDFPRMEKEWSPLIELDGFQLKSILHNVNAFTYNDPGTSISNIHFKNTPEYLCIGATNHFSCCCYKIDESIDKEIAFMISKETSSLVSEILSTGKCYIYYNDDGSLRFQTEQGDIQCVGHAFEGNPVMDYYSLSKKYIDRDSDIITIVDKTYFKDQVKKAIAFSPYDRKSLLIHVLDNMLRLEVEDYISHKRSVQEIEVLMEKEGSVSLMGLPYDHLTRIIGSLENESFDMKIPKEHGPGMRCVKDAILVEDAGFTYLIMPLSV